MQGVFEKKRANPSKVAPKIYPATMEPTLRVAVFNIRRISDSDLIRFSQLFLL